MSFLIVGGPLAGGWKADSDSGYKAYNPPKDPKNPEKSDRGTGDDHVTRF